MNTSIFSVKTGVVGVALLSLFTAIYIANASVVLNSATINGGASATVLPGASVTVDVTATKSGSACENNWGFTRVTVDGVATESNLNSYIGTGQVSDQVIFTAPNADGDYTVLVELFRGVEDGLDCTGQEQLWESTTLDLTVFTPVEPSVVVQNLSPLGVERVLGDTDPLVFTAEVVLDGDPEVPHVQCVIFDIFNSDGYEPITVSFDAVGTYDEEDGVSDSFDLSGFATGTYNMLVVALESACDNLPGDFDTADYLHSEDTNVMRTIITVAEEEDEVQYCEDKGAANFGEEGECVYEATYYNIEGYKWNDANGDGLWDEGEDILPNWTIILSDSDGEIDRQETDEFGYYNFMVEAGTWFVSEEQQDGWQQTGVLFEGDSESESIDGLNCYFDIYEDDYEAVVDLSLNQETVQLLAVSEAVYQEYNSYRCDFGNQLEEEVEEDDRSSGRSTGTRVGSRQAPTGQVLGATTDGSTDAPTCGLFLYDYMRAGIVTYAAEVMKLQMFLTGQGFFTPATGIFDETTEANVRLFQAAHESDVLVPWNITDPTGYVYKTTRWKINNLVCPGSEAFPDLSGEL